MKPRPSKETMTEQKDHLFIARWAKNLGELNHEIARLALLCQVRILDPGVIEQVLQKDTSVCGTPNPLAFTRLHDMLTMYFAIREKADDALGRCKQW
jgi:hypothetical protein